MRNLSTTKTLLISCQVSNTIVFSWFGLVLWIREGIPGLVCFSISPWNCIPWAPPKCSSQWYVESFRPNIGSQNVEWTSFSPRSGHPESDAALLSKALLRTAGFPGIPGGTPPVVVASASSTMLHRPGPYCDRNPSDGGQKLVDNLHHNRAVDIHRAPITSVPGSATPLPKLGAKLCQICNMSCCIYLFVYLCIYLVIYVYIYMYI